MTTDPSNPMANARALLEQVEREREDYRQRVEELETVLREMAEHIIDGSARPGACSPCEQLVELARAALDQDDR